jgi:hypothetical protein
MEGIEKGYSSSIFPSSCSSVILFKNNCPYPLI